jgi:HEAT repeat protein
MAPSISVIVRFHNEITHIGAVFRAVRAQRTAHGVEIVAVDNASTDGSREFAEEYADQLIDIDDYRPGYALNRAVETARGDTVVIVSAHAVPEDDRWLANLTADTGRDDVLGVYGAQVYPLHAKFLDKCDLDIFSDPRPRREAADTDFWNANSAFRRAFWERCPFDEDVIELEDHHWTKRQLPDPALAVHFEPKAAVYHYGHETRNDRAFLEPSDLTDAQRIARARRLLESPDETWPTVMRAGMDLAALPGHPDVRGAVPALCHQLAEHPDFDVRWRMAGALGRIADPASLPFLIRGLEDRSFYARDECAWSLGRFGPAAVPALLAARDRIAAEHRPFLALALGLTGAPEGVTAATDLIRASLAEGGDAERTAIYFLGEFARDASDDLLDTVAARLASEDAMTARAAAWCWGVLAEDSRRPGSGLRAVMALADDHPEATVRAEAVVALGRIARSERGEDRIAEVGAALRDDAGRVRQAAMQSLRLAVESGGAQAGLIAEAHPLDPDFGVNFERELAVAALRKDQGEAQ